MSNKSRFYLTYSTSPSSFFMVITSAANISNRRTLNEIHVGYDAPQKNLGSPSTVFDSSSTAKYVALFGSHRVVSFRFHRDSFVDGGIS